MHRRSEHDIRRKTRVLDHVKQNCNVSHTCREYTSRGIFYSWKKHLGAGGLAALVNSKSCPESANIHISKDIEEKYCLPGVSSAWAN